MIKSIALACCAVLLAASSQNIFAQATYKLRGKVVDATLKEPLPGANIQILETGKVVTAGVDGTFEAKIDRRNVTIRVSFTGHKTIQIAVDLASSGSQTLELEEESKELSEVIVTGVAANQNVSTVELGVNKLSIATLSKLPALMGEVDVVKSLLLLPGVTTIGEGSSGFYVRGGNSDQNLILLDDAPVFNSSHLMGLLSVFNADLIKDFSFYKGTIPAQYGGRASSVLAINTRRAQESFSVQGGVGLISNRFLIETPIIKNKLSAIAGIRFSFPEYLFKATNNAALQEAGANFYDFTSRVDFALNANNNFHFTAYLSDDLFRFSDDSLSSSSGFTDASQYRWTTENFTAGWVHSFSKTLSGKLTLVQSDYTSIIGSPAPANSFDLTSSIFQQSAKADIGYQSEKFAFSFGGEMISYRVNPGKLDASQEAILEDLNIPQERGFERAAFVATEYNPVKWFGVQAGLRYSAFSRLGKSEIYSYAEGKPITEDNIVDTTFIGENNIVKSYGGWEPRLSLKFQLSKSTSIKAGYGISRQYLHRVANNTAALPTDRWQLSNGFIRPLVSEQISGGVFKNFRSNQFEFSAEVFWKELSNIADYKDGADLLLSTAVETQVIQGRGISKGVEVQLKKATGNFSGWINYTYSQTRLLVKGRFRDETINFGEWYPANFDKPHNMNAIFSYTKSKRVYYGLNFTYSTGRPVTYPHNRYYVGQVLISNFTTRNQDRIPDYHRLDFSLTIEPPKSSRRYKGTWVFTLYNVYARRNAFSVFVNTDIANSLLFSSDSYKLSIFATIIPSLSYNFKF